jgi:hypothetical protein
MGCAATSIWGEMHLHGVTHRKLSFAMQLIIIQEFSAAGWRSGAATDAAFILR